MPRIGILGTTGNTLAIARELLSIGNYEIIFWEQGGAYSSPIVQKTTLNPFAAIAEADVVIIARIDGSSYGLVAESILALKPVIIDNLHLFTLREINDLSKLSQEAEVPVVPYIDPRIFACARYIQQLFPDGIRFVDGVIKGNSDPMDSADPLFTLMLFLTLMFRGNILRNHAEIFYRARTESPAFFLLYFNYRISRYLL